MLNSVLVPLSISFMFVSFVGALMAIFGRCYKAIYPRWFMLRALERGEFIAYIQPIIDGYNEVMYGGEILMRWNHSTRGIISPENFIPMAEKNKLIIPMTRSLMYQVQNLLGPKAAALPPRFHFSFNISISHLKEPSLVEDCKSFISAFSKNPIELILELTESDKIIFDSSLLKTLGDLKDAGVRIAIDDFGIGYSGLLYLQKINVNFVKIDKAFITPLSDVKDVKTPRIIDNIIDLTNRMGVSLIAEGIENKEQAESLIERGVNIHQGYFYSKPKPIGTFYTELSSDVNIKYV